MSFIKHSVSIVRSSTAAGNPPATTIKSMTPRSLMLAASAIAATMSGTTFAGEPTAVDYFIARAMMTQGTEAVSHNSPTLAGDGMVDESAKNRFVEQVLKGRFPETFPVSRVTNTSPSDQASWPDFSYLVGSVPSR